VGEWGRIDWGNQGCKVVLEQVLSQLAGGAPLERGIDIEMAEFVSALADVSTMWLVLLSFIFCLIPLAIVGGMVYGMYKLLNALPSAFQRGQSGMVKVAEEADKFSKKVSAPVISASAAGSQIKGMLREIITMNRRNS
jgi:hypothetical protein